MPLDQVPEGMMVHNIELYPGQGAKVARAAGAYARITGRDGDMINLKMRSGEIRSFSKDCMATIGVVSNLEHFNEKLGKAGVNVNRGRRPTVRGIAMNPVDHHNGGRTNGGKRLSNFNGRCIRGKKTRSPKKLSNRLIIRRAS
jgi:large subunit ribosomal protein L2